MKLTPAHLEALETLERALRAVEDAKARYEHLADDPHQHASHCIGIDHAYHRLEIARIDLDRAERDLRQFENPQW